MSFTVLVAPSGFKESLDVDDVTRAISAGVLRACPSAKLLQAPMVDGGEGFTKALVGSTGGVMIDCTVTGPVGQPVKSFFGFMGGGGQGWVEPGQANRHYRDGRRGGPASGPARQPRPDPNDKPGRR